MRTDIVEAASRFGDPALREPVFVVGMNGSGTTMLLDCLGRHSALYGFPRETRAIPWLIDSHERFGPLEEDANFERLWNHVAGLLQFRLANGGEPRPLPEGWQRCSRDLSGLLNMMFDSFAMEEGKHRWCEKSPQYAQHMLRLKELFPRARFVHVIRDGRDCACSFQRRWGRSPTLTMTRWKLVVQEARRQGALLGDHYLEIRYEDLTASPELWMRRLCRFLGVPFERAVLHSSQPYLGNSGPGAAPTGGLHRNSGKWRRHFAPRTLRRLERIGGRVLHECGYGTSDPQGDHSPPRWQRRLLSARDAAYQFSREILLKLSGRLARPWRVILNRPLAAYRNRNRNAF